MKRSVNDLENSNPKKLQKTGEVIETFVELAEHDVPVPVVSDNPVNQNTTGKTDINMGENKPQEKRSPMAAMPVDLLVEMSYYVPKKTVVRMSALNKEFHDIVCGKNRREFWEMWFKERYGYTAESACGKEDENFDCKSSKCQDLLEFIDKQAELLDDDKFTKVISERFLADEKLDPVGEVLKNAHKIVEVTDRNGRNAKKKFRLSTFSLFRLCCAINKNIASEVFRQLKYSGALPRHYKDFKHKDFGIRQGVKIEKQDEPSMLWIKLYKYLSTISEKNLPSKEEAEKKIDMMIEFSKYTDNDKRVNVAYATRMHEYKVGGESINFKGDDTIELLKNLERYVSTYISFRVYGKDNRLYACFGNTVKPIGENTRFFSTQKVLKMFANMRKSFARGQSKEIKDRIKQENDIMIYVDEKESMDSYFAKRILVSELKEVMDNMDRKIISLRDDYEKKKREEGQSKQMETKARHGSSRGRRHGKREIELDAADKLMLELADNLPIRYVVDMAGKSKYFRRIVLDSDYGIWNKKKKKDEDGDEDEDNVDQDDMSVREERERPPMHLDIKKGGLHRALGVPSGKKIPPGKLKKALHSKDPHVRRMANFARNTKKWHH